MQGFSNNLAKNIVFVANNGESKQTAPRERKQRLASAAVVDRVKRMQNDLINQINDNEVSPYSNQAIAKVNEA